MSVFFNGREIITPATASQVDDSAMFNRNPGIGNILAVLGDAEAGQPKTALRYGQPVEAAAELRGGPLLDSIQRSFGGTLETPGPSTVIGVRVGPATRSARTLLDAASANVIALQSQVWGSLANRIKVSIANGTNLGKKITTQLDTQSYEGDDIARTAARVRYSGAAASATVSVTSTEMVLAAPAGSTVATIAFADFPTVDALVDRISQVTDWTATVIDGNGEHATAASLDFKTAADAKTADLDITANLQAIVDWFNGVAEPLVVATKSAGAGTVPANIAGAFLTGAINGTTTVTDWADALTALQLEDVQWIAAASSDPAVHALISAHCKFMSDVMGKERRAILGTPVSTADAAAIALAKAIGSDRVSLTHLGIYDYDTAGRLRLYPPYVAAAMVAGGFAGVNPGVAMTNKALSIRGIERKLRVPTDTDLLLKGGIMPIAETPTGYKVVQSISTWLTNQNYNRREMSCGAAVDFTLRSLREALDPLRGKGQSPGLLAEARTRGLSSLRQLAKASPEGLGVLVGDADNPAYKNIVIRIEGDALFFDAQVSPVIPNNYILVTVRVVPWSGTLAG